MIVKEKLVFWPLAAVFIGMLVFGFVSQGKKEGATKDLLKEIEVATKKSRAKKKAKKDKLDVKMLKTEDNLDMYELLLKRSPFFRVRDVSEIKKVEVIPLKKEEPKRKKNHLKSQRLKRRRKKHLKLKKNQNQKRNKKKRFLRKKRKY